MAIENSSSVYMRKISIEVVFYWEEFSGRPEQWLAEGIKCLHNGVQLLLKKMRKDSLGYPILEVELSINWPGYEDVNEELIIEDAIAAQVDGIAFYIKSNTRKLI